MITDTDEFLAHHGVKGQKWGIRKANLHEGIKTGTQSSAKGYVYRHRYGVATAASSLVLGPFALGVDFVGHIIKKRQIKNFGKTDIGNKATIEYLAKHGTAKLPK